MKHARFRASAGKVWVGLALLLVIGCHGDRSLGVADSFVVYAPAAGGARIAAGPVVVPLAPDDPRAQPLFEQLAVGFPGEVLRTDYLAKQLVRDAMLGGRRYPEPARTAAGEPTAFLVSAPDGREVERGLSLKGMFGTPEAHPDVVWIGLPAYPDHDRALPQTLAGLLARVVANRVAAGAGAEPPAALVNGYARALEVIAREWRVGEGVSGTLAPDAGTTAQRQLFAAVRENQFAVGADGKPRPAQELLSDPGLAATVLYRLVQSKTVGRKVAPAEVYAPFVTDRIPPGVSPAAVLGPFRNFQAKLLSAWGRAVLEGRPPKDIADLVEAYGRALPAERAEVIRIFVVTTYGATVRRGGVPLPAGEPGAALPELTALAAEVAAGKVSLRGALPPESQRASQ
ncbi:MAG TPA: hypothetical protein VHH90_08150 [Polyangia bacterium]|nr:hypothetical protein [Polyangia bacterium]